MSPEYLLTSGAVIALEAFNVPCGVLVAEVIVLPLANATKLPDSFGYGKYEITLFVESTDTTIPTADPTTSVEALRIIVSTVGAAAKGPFKQFQASKAQKTQSQQQSEADLFGSLIA